MVMNEQIFLHELLIEPNEGEKKLNYYIHN